MYFRAVLQALRKTNTARGQHEECGCNREVAWILSSRCGVSLEQRAPANDGHGEVVPMHSSLTPWLQAAGSRARL
jgi:hypothetical protein